MIEVTHTVNDFTAQAGGIASCTYELARTMNERSNDVHIQIIATRPKSRRIKMMGEKEDWIHSVHNDEKTAFGQSENIRRMLDDSESDIYHTNGLWRFCNHYTAKTALKKNKPLVISPQGMLYPQALAHSWWKKQILKWLYFGNDIHNATCMHATCEDEMQTIRKYGYKGPVAIIGNSINIPPYLSELPQRQDDGVVRIGYMGQLHPRKHVERILYAISKLPRDQRERCEFNIMGGGEADYQIFLRSEVARLGLMKQVKWLGFLQGRDKFNELAQLSALFVPSDFENFGMIVGEALLAQTPVFASSDTPWKELTENQCGWWQPATVDNMEAIIRDLFEMDMKQINEMGARGRCLIEQQYAPNIIQDKMQQLYMWLADQQEKPAFIYD